MTVGKWNPQRLWLACPSRMQLHIARKRRHRRTLLCVSNSYSSVLVNIGQGFQSSPFENLRELIEQRAMHQAICGQGLAAVQLEDAAAKIRQLAACFFDHQHTRSRVPRIEV